MLIGPLRRLFRRGFSYKQVASTGIRGRESNSSESDDDTDSYSEADELVHGVFVYCAFLMLGSFTVNPTDNRNGNAIAYVRPRRS